MSEEDFETIGEKEVTCPYCGHEETDSHEYEDLEGSTLTCGECDKRFYASRDITVTYRTSRDCKLNGNEHDFGDWEATHIENFLWRQCKSCPRSEGKRQRNES